MYHIQVMYCKSLDHIIISVLSLGTIHCALQVTIILPSSLGTIKIFVHANRIFCGAKIISLSVHAGGGGVEEEIIIAMSCRTTMVGN